MHNQLRLRKLFIIFLSFSQLTRSAQQHRLPVRRSLQPHGQHRSFPVRQSPCGQPLRAAALPQRPPQGARGPTSPADLHDLAAFHAHCGQWWGCKQQPFRYRARRVCIPGAQAARAGLSQHTIGDDCACDGQESVRAAQGKQEQENDGQ